MGHPAARPSPRRLTGTRRPGLTKEDFQIDWDNRTLACPNGITSPPWGRPWATGTPGCPSSSPRKACRECDDRVKCTGNVDGKGRHILLLPEPQQKIHSQVRKDQKTGNWQRHYAIRAGCEANASETVQTHGLRHCRYRGLTKTHVQHVLTAAASGM
ncbi:transposase [Streptomyces sp. NPDC006872]|uniref:transposase n=1 Tax=Streptomyces sp. NPDC006872 TaxID=3155720 RepID=UPI0033F60CAC